MPSLTEALNGPWGAFEEAAPEATWNPVCPSCNGRSLRGQQRYLYNVPVSQWHACRACGVEYDGTGGWIEPEGATMPRARLTNGRELILSREPGDPPEQRSAARCPDCGAELIRRNERWHCECPEPADLAPVSLAPEPHEAPRKFQPAAKLGRKAVLEES